MDAVAQAELDKLLGEERLRHVPVLVGGCGLYLASASQARQVLGNKIDVPRAASESELRGAGARFTMCGRSSRSRGSGAMGLHLTTGKDRKSVETGIRPIEVFMCSIIQ